MKLDLSISLKRRVQSAVVLVIIVYVVLAAFRVGDAARDCSSTSPSMDLPHYLPVDYVNAAFLYGLVFVAQLFLPWIERGVGLLQILAVLLATAAIGLVSNSNRFLYDNMVWTAVIILTASIVAIVIGYHSGLPGNSKCFS